MTAPSTTSARDGRTDPTRPRPWLALVVFTAVVAVVSFVGNLSTRSGMDGWYQDLDRPSWQPPDGVFGPVWGALYVAIIVSAWLVWKEVGLSRAHVPWLVQLVLNAGWTIIFFGLESPTWALVEIVMLLAAIAWTIVVFWPIHRVAAALLVPYLGWVAFATALTAYISMNN